MRTGLLVVAALAATALGVPLTNRMRSAESPPQARPETPAGRVVRPLTKASGPAPNEHALEPDWLQRENPLATYRGTVVRVQPDAKGADLTTQEEIVAIFAKLDKAPAQRVAHFAWLLQREGTKRTGWNGTIVDYEPAADGCLVTIRFCPRFYIPGQGYSATTDYVLETYRFSRGRLAFIGAVDPPDANRIIIFN